MSWRLQQLADSLLRRATQLGALREPTAEERARARELTTGYLREWLGAKLAGEPEPEAPCGHAEAVERFGYELSALRDEELAALEQLCSGRTATDARDAWDEVVREREEKAERRRRHREREIARLWAKALVGMARPDPEAASSDGDPADVIPIEPRLRERPS